MKVTTFTHGAHSAYALIETPEKTLDVLLEAGKGPASSLRSFAQDQRDKAHRLLRNALLADRAADQIDTDTLAAGRAQPKTE